MRTFHTSLNVNMFFEGALGVRTGSRCHRDRYIGLTWKSGYKVFVNFNAQAGGRGHCQKAIVLMQGRQGGVGPAVPVVFNAL